MKFRSHSASTAAIFCTFAMGVSGCKKPHIRVYLAPREVAAAPAADAPPEPEENRPARPRPQLTYTLPAGWTEAQANSVSVAGFAIKVGGAEANVAITPLPNLAGREAMVVNMWREQAGLPPIENDELAKTLEERCKRGTPDESRSVFAKFSAELENVFAEVRDFQKGI